MASFCDFAKTCAPPENNPRWLAVRVTMLEETVMLNRPMSAVISEQAQQCEQLTDLVRANGLTLRRLQDYGLPLTLPRRFLIVGDVVHIPHDHSRSFLAAMSAAGIQIRPKARFDSVSALHQLDDGAQQHLLTAACQTWRDQ